MTVSCPELSCRQTNVCRFVPPHLENCTWMQQLSNSDQPRKGDWMEMCDGSEFWPTDPRPWDFDIEVIAEHLSKNARFNGATHDCFYSVAQHCVHVSLLVPPACAMGALLHDAWEAISSDVIRPIKNDPVMEGFRHLERRGEQALADRFGIEYPWCPEIRLADNIALATEKRDLMAPTKRAWHPLPDPDPTTIQPLEWRDARSLYLARYSEIERALR